MITMMGPALLLAVVQAPQGPCSAEALGKTLRDRLQALAAGSNTAVPEDIVFSIKFAEGAWRLKVSGAGRREVRRTLALPRGECTLAAETAALVVERSLVGVWRDPLSERSPTRPAESPPEVPTFVEAPPAIEDLPPPQGPDPLQAMEDPPDLLGPQASRLVAPPTAAGAQAEPIARAGETGFSAGGAGLLGRTGDWQPGFHVQLSRRTQGWSFAVSFAAAAGSEGQLRERWSRPSSGAGTGLLALSVGRCRGETVRACAGPYLALRASGAGDASQPAALQIDPEAGAALGLEVALSRRLRLGLTFLAGVPLAADSRDAEYGGRSFTLTAAASLGFLVF